MYCLGQRVQSILYNNSLEHSLVLTPTLVYTKTQVFNVGDNIGSDSQKFITDNKLYQKHAILIKSELESK